MKKQIVATLTLGVLAVTAVVAACNVPARVGSTTTTEQEPSVFAPAQVKVITDLERLEVMQTSIGMLINDCLNRGQEVPEYLFNQCQKIQDARLALYEMDGQGEALSMLVMQYYAAGAAAPDCVFDRMDAVERSRAETLQGIGLY